MDTESAANTSSGKGSAVISRVVGCLVIIYLTAGILQIALSPDAGFQVNFKIYYHAAKVMVEGVNPYDPSVLESSAGAYVLPCGYPPLVLHLYRPFAAFEYAAAYRLYLLVKVAALVFLVWLWHAAFLKRKFDGWFLLICLIGFNCAIYWDLLAGNITLFEQALLWFGFYQLTRHRLGAFTCCVVAASLCKITPMFFLVLLLFVRPRSRAWAWLAAGAAMFIAFHLVNVWLYPDLWAAWRESIGQLGGMVHPGDSQASAALSHSPATWPFINLVCYTAMAKLGLPVPAALPIAVFGAVVAVVCGASLAAVRKSMKSGGPGEAAHYLLDMACLVYLLITPRLMVYSYIVGLLPAYRTALRIRSLNALGVLVVLMAIQTIEGRPPGMNLFYEISPAFVPLFLAFAIWFAAVAQKWRSPNQVQQKDGDI